MENTTNTERYSLRFKTTTTFESEDEARAKLEEFIAQVELLREQYQMSDLSLTLVVAAKAEDGSLVKVAGGMSCGDRAHAMGIAIEQFDQFFLRKFSYRFSNSIRLQSAPQIEVSRISQEDSCPEPSNPS